MMPTNGNERKDGGERATDEVSDTMGREDSDFHELYVMLNSFEANLDQLTESCYGVYANIGVNTKRVYTANLKVLENEEIVLALCTVEHNNDVDEENKIGRQIISNNLINRLNQLELDCIDLLQPIGDIISLERELKRLCEVESNYMSILKENVNN